MKPKNGDMYVKDQDQIIIFHGAIPADREEIATAITAVFGGPFSGNFGKAEQWEIYFTFIEKDDPSFTYIGNISDIFRSILCKK